ncbi:TPA: hypothetical protein ACH3X1_003804 [Trebouxia sp. C0004]
MTSTMSSVAARTTGRSSLPVALRCGCQISTPRPFASGTKLKTTRSLCRMRPTTQQRQVVTMGIFGLGGPEIAVIAGVAVLIFGPSKIPGLGKEVGKAAKSFQQAAKEFENELKSDTADAEQKVDASRKEKQQ